MIGKLFTVFAVVASMAVAEPCGYCGGYLPAGCGVGYVSSLNSNAYGNVYPSRVLSTACTVPAVSAYPVGSPVATPAVTSCYDSAVATPVFTTGAVRSGLFGYNTFSGCRTGLLSAF